MVGAAVELGTVGLALCGLLVVAARDAGRPGNSSPIGLACLRTVGGLGLAAMAFLALRAEAPMAASIAAIGALPLLAGLVGSARGGRATLSMRGARPLDQRSDSRPAEERRAA